MVTAAAFRREKPLAAATPSAGACRPLAAGQVAACYAYGHSAAIRPGCLQQAGLLSIDSAGLAFCSRSVEARVLPAVPAERRLALCSGRGSVRGQLPHYRATRVYWRSQRQERGRRPPTWRWALPLVARHGYGSTASNTRQRSLRRLRPWPNSDDSRYSRSRQALNQ